MTSRILVVDDEVDLLLAMNVLLASAGYEVIEAQSGTKALELAEREDPDLVILDLGLPDMSGVDVLGALRTARRRPKIVIVSAHTSGHTEARLLREGVDAYLTKPFNADDLIRTLKETLAEDAPT